MADESERFMWWTAVVILVALLFTLSFTLSQYQRSEPAQDCRPNIYPICYRASAPGTIPPASPVAVFFSVAGTGVLALILIYAAHHASVMRQANLIVATAEMRPQPAQAKQEPKQEPKAETKAEPVQSGASLPAVIPSTTKDIQGIQAPKAKPKKGVDVGLVS